MPSRRTISGTPGAGTAGPKTVTESRSVCGTVRAIAEGPRWRWFHALRELAAEAWAPFTNSEQFSARLDLNSALSKESNSCRSATKAARPLRHREHLGLAGKDLLGEHAMDLVISVRARVVQYGELVVAVSRFSQSG